VVLAVTGARVSFSGSRTRPAGADPSSAEFGAAGQWEHGFLDAVVPAAGSVTRWLSFSGCYPRSPAATTASRPRWRHPW